MATNEILRFAEIDTGTNLLTQTEYSADSQRPIGNQPGVARSKLVNKALRQSSLIAAAVAQFIADNQANNVVDTATPADIADWIEAAVRSITNDQYATTEFVNAKIAADRPFEATAANIKMDGAQSVGTRNTVARADHVHPTDTSRAPLASPALTGTPTAPTAPVGTNTTQIANMAAVQNEFAARKFVSGDFLLSPGGSSTINHTLGAIPANTCLFARCVLAEGGFAIGDVIALGQITTDNDMSGQYFGFTLKLTTAAVSIKVANGGIWVVRDNGNSYNVLATANAWKFFIVATL